MNSLSYNEFQINTLMKIREIITEGTQQPSDIYPQSKDVGGGNIILNHSVNQFGLIDEFEISYVDHKNKLNIKYVFKNGRTVRYDSDNMNGIIMPNNPPISIIRQQFINKVNDIMKDNYEKLTISQNQKNDWTMTQIKKSIDEAIPSENSEGLPVGLKAAMSRFDELAASYEQHLKMLKSNLDQ